VDKIDGQIKDSFAALDPNTSYLLSTMLSQMKDHKGARKLFYKLAEVTGHNKINSIIKTITSDALTAYETAIELSLLVTEIQI
jgi:hypothetical protein